MYMRKGLAVVISLACALGAAAAVAGDRPGLGKPVTEADLALWDISIGPDGAGLPPGSSFSSSCKSNSWWYCNIRPNSIRSTAGVCGSASCCLRELISFSSGCSVNARP